MKNLLNRLAWILILYTILSGALVLSGVNIGVSIPHVVEIETEDYTHQRNITIVLIVSSALSAVAGLRILNRL
jgi:hypothetical protein